MKLFIGLLIYSVFFLGGCLGSGSSNNDSLPISVANLISDEDNSGGGLTGMFAESDDGADSNFPIGAAAHGPEPATLGLLASGLLGYGIIKFRKKG